MAFNGVGAALRAERMRQGLSLSDVSRRTRIPQKFLTDIEAESFDALPGTIFARNFVRTYATEIGLDAEPLLAEMPRVDVSRAPMPARVRREERSAWDSPRNSTVASIAWGFLAVAAATAAYVHFNKPDTNRPKVSVPVQPKPAEVNLAPAPGVPGDPAQPAILPAATPASSAGRAVQVILTAREAAWVQISADGQNAFTGLLQPSEKREVAADQVVKLVTGNAGGVTVTLNGKTLEPLGPAGQVRTVRLTAEGLQLVPKISPPPPDPL